MVGQPRAMPWADIIRPFGAKRAKYIVVFFVGNHLNSFVISDYFISKNQAIAHKNYHRFIFSNSYIMPTENDTAGYSCDNATL
jgi:hypothetical protein